VRASKVDEARERWIPERRIEGGVVDVFHDRKQPRAIQLFIQRAQAFLKRGRNVMPNSTAVLADECGRFVT
jgi:hypothetical protein